MSQNLITRERAQQNVGQTTLSAAEGRLLDHTVAAVSDAIARHCRRDFLARAYDEVLDGSGTPELLLSQYPILAVERVATAPTPVLAVANTSATNQRATIQATRDGLTLTRVASGVMTVDTSVTWAANPTLAQVATAVTALGNGWSASAAANYSGRPSADLRPIQGALNCAGSSPASLLLHVEELSAYGVEAERGVLVYGAEGWGPTFPWETAVGRPCWARGRRLYRIVYTAGYETVPEAVQEAAAEWAAALWWQAKRDPAALQVQVAGAGFQVFAATRDLPGHLKVLLEPYRRYPLGGL